MEMKLFVGKGFSGDLVWRISDKHYAYIDGQKYNITKKGWTGNEMHFTLEKPEKEYH
jgi:hypothetical protein